MDCTTKRMDLNIEQLRLEQPRPKTMPRGFIQCLDLSRHEKRADDYYWLHQQQLENSALQFRALKMNNKSFTKAANEIRLTLSDEGRQTDRLEKLTPPLMQSKQLSVNTNSKTWLDDLDELIHIIRSQFIQLSALIIAQLNLRGSISKVFTQNLGNKMLFPFFSYKNYQLFIEANEAELSLNSMNLNKEQTKELSLLIKQQLNKKGIQLKHLVINGVKQ